MNHGKYHTNQYKSKIALTNDRRFGPLIDHNKNCVCCGKEYTFKGRKKTKAYKKSKYCSRSCANNRQEWWNNNAKHYRTVAFQHWDYKCAICGFDKIVAVHHIDENHKNNDIKNLIPLCPNHHEMIHSKWSHEVVPLVKKIIQETWGIGESGITQDLHS